MPRKLQDNPLQRDLARTGRSSSERYLRPFFERPAAAKNYSGLGITAYRELTEIPEEFRTHVYRLARKRAWRKGRKRILSSDIADSAREYILQQVS